MTNRPSLAGRASGTLSLRLALSFVPVLVAAAVAVGFVFDQGRVEVLKARELEQLRLHAERSAGEMDRYIEHLRRDTLFLAGTPPIQGIARALAGRGQDSVGASSLGQWQERLQQIFLAFAATRPEYFQLRLIGAQDSGRELVRVERDLEGLHTTPAEELQRKGHRYYFQRASELAAGSVYLSDVDLNRENKRISVPYQPTMRAATAVYDEQARLFGVVVINMDMRYVFERVTSYLDALEQAYVVDEQGRFLLHPDPAHAFNHELDNRHLLEDEHPGWMNALTEVPEGQGAFVEDARDPTASAVYASVRAFEGQDPGHRFMILLEKRAEHLFQGLGVMQRDSLLIMGGLLILAIVLVVMISRRMTRSLSALAFGAEKIAGGDYRAELPPAGGGEVGQLAAAFRRMVAEVERREQALTDLNRNLERRVEERTREIADQKALLELVIESVGDGVVVTDCDGRFLLWNRVATDIVGSGPSDVPPERWSTHFGVFRNPSGEPVPEDELPLVRAMHGIPSDGVELFLQHSETAEGRWVQVTGRPLRDTDGALIGGVAAMLDVTAQKELKARVEEHRAELHRVGRLALTAEIAASAAHNLSQPVAALETYAQVALRLQRDGRLDDEQLVTILEKIENLSSESGHALDRLRALIHRQQQSPVPIEVNAVVRSCIEGLAERIQRQGILCVPLYAQSIPLLRGDPIELEQMLAQLTTNALEAMVETPPDRRQLYITTSHHVERDLVVIEIEDTGPGVDAHRVNYLFEPWEPGKTGALGLGLPIVQNIVEDFRGQVSYEKGSRGGALFRVELPVPMEESV